MSSDIVSLLHLNKISSSRVTVVKQLDRCDSSFVTSCILNHCIKNKSPVIVLGMHNSLQHYQNVGLKMNYNIQRYIDTGLVNYFNLGEYCINRMLLDNKLPQLFIKVKDVIMLMKQSHDSVNVILEGVTHLFDLGYSLKEVNAFCNELMECVTSCNNSFVVCHCDVTSDDDVTYVMSNLLSHKAHTVVEVGNLSSGWSTDISGHITIKYPGFKFDDEHLYTMNMKPSKYLFKLFDRGIKLFAPGTI